MNPADSAQLILDNIQDFAVIGTDAEGQITLWNPGAQRLFGFSAEAAVGRNLALLFTPEDQAAGQPAQERATALELGHMTEERWLVRQDGSHIFASGVLRPIRTADGEMRGFTKVCRDMTEQKQLLEALNEADRRKNDFIATLGHELRNPLAAIQNAILLAKGKDGAEHAAWSQRVIERQAKQISRLAEDLLDVSRTGQGTMQLRKEATDLGGIITRAVEAVRPLLETRQHEIAVSTAPGPLRLEADPARLEQVLVNLLKNAIAYTEPGGLISICARTEGTECVVEVEDNGMGIAPEAMPHIFDLFAQASAPAGRVKGGLGLGLTLVKRIVELHGGSVSVENDGLAQGTRFSVRIPSHSPVGEPAASEPTDLPVPERRPAARVLVVDDNVDSATGLAKLLKVRKHEVETAFDGETGLELARGFAPDLVLLDLNLPDTDGYELARKLRAEDCCRNSLLIAVTGYGSDQDRERAKVAGFDHYLMKPVDVDTILRLTRNIAP